jgi:hypothetical protein
LLDDRPVKPETTPDIFQSFCACAIACDHSRRITRNKMRNRKSDNRNAKDHKKQQDEARNYNSGDCHRSMPFWTEAV